MSIALIKKYFPDLEPEKLEKFQALGDLYREWNEKINVISRKDIDSLYEKHILHSLAIAKLFPLKAGDEVLDIGTGGGFPGIPLAIFFPDAEFLLVDSIGKKIQVVDGIIESLGLRNAQGFHGRAEDIPKTFDVIVSRAVAPMLKLANWGEKKLKKNAAEPGCFVLLKGGDLKEEILDFRKYYKWYKVKEVDLSKYFSGEFFETKKIIFISR